MKVFKKVVKTFFMSLILFIFILITGLNVVRRFVCFDYYNNCRKVCKIAGLGDGFIPQGLGYSEEEKLILQSGYLVGSNKVVIYLIDEDGKSKRINVMNQDGSHYVGHFGGIATFHDFVYCSEDYQDENGDLSNRVYVFSLQELMETKNNGNITVENYFLADTEGACISVDNGYLYVGEYYYPKLYETDTSHHITTPNGIKQNAFSCAYKLDENQEYGVGDLEFQISIPDKVQGFTIHDGVGIISQSWGPTLSKLGFYNVEKTDLVSSSSGKEVPLYTMDETTLIKEVTLPSMSEGIFVKDNRVHIYFESAGNKYLFGKLFNDYYITSYPFINK